VPFSTRPWRSGGSIPRGRVNSACSRNCRCPQQLTRTGATSLRQRATMVCYGASLVDMMRIVRDGALLSAVASTYLLALLRFNPRIFLGHYPKEIRRVVPPRSDKEKRISLLLGLIIAAPATSTLVWRTSILESHSFWDRFAYAFGVLFIFNLVDLLILDWLIVCWLQPRWIILPGTEHITIPNPYLHHLKEFLLGTAGLVVAGLAIAALLSIHF